LIGLLPINSAEAREYLSAEEITAISLASGGIAWLGHELRNWDTTRAPLLKGPLPLETSVQRFLGRSDNPGAGKTNFLDDNLGSAITPAIAGALLLATDLSHPQGERGKEATQDVFLFVSGLVATRGITDIAKGIVTRPRPYRTIGPIDQRASNGFGADRSSFPSGHASSAFFSAAYLNLRLRAVMRTEMNPDEYRRWRWAPPSFLFSWASFVGLSRIHAYKHYLSDVLMGAVAGYLLAELFFSFGESGRVNAVTSDSPGMMLRLRFPL
jgi:membrane-associated phospholipid phosphatase